MSKPHYMCFKLIKLEFHWMVSKIHLNPLIDRFWPRKF